VRYPAASVGNRIPTFRGNEMSSSSRFNMFQNNCFPLIVCQKSGCNRRQQFLSGFVRPACVKWKSVSDEECVNVSWNSLISRIVYGMTNCSKPRMCVCMYVLCMRVCMYVCMYAFIGMILHILLNRIASLVL
jgi:hypothetical protein